MVSSIFFMRFPGFFITVEGVEGSGKTTQIRRLARALTRAGHRVTLTREPGGTALADRLRAVLLDPATAGLPPLAELLLYAAARADHVERRILPALRHGRTVLCDRFLDATIAYQGYGRGLSRALIRSVHAHPPLTVRPDLTILLDVDPAASLARARARNRASTRAGGRAEGRFEEETLAFHRRVAAGYRAIARADRTRVCVVDGSGTPAEVARRISGALDGRLRRRQRPPAGGASGRQRLARAPRTRVAHARGRR